MTPPTSASTAAGSARKRLSINASVNETLARLYSTANGSRELVSKARGVLVFPSVVSAAFIVGGQYGEGALRIGGDTAGYYSTATGSFGLQAGAQSKALIFMFMTQDSLDRFRNREGWAVGVDATVAVLKVGVNGKIDTTTATAPVQAFVLTNAGLMAGVSLEGTKLHRVIGRIGDLQHLHSSVPFRRIADNTRQLLTQRRERHIVVDKQEYRANDLGAATGPVRERIFDQPLQWHDQPPLVPKPDCDVGARDFLDTAPLALDDHHVIEPDGLRQRNLQAGDHVAEHRPRGDTGHQARDPGRREQARADLPNVRKHHQHRRDADHHDQRHDRAGEHARLRMDAPRMQVVGHIERVRGDDRVADAGDRAHRQQRQQADQRKADDVAHDVDQRELVRRLVQHEVDAEHGQRIHRCPFDRTYHDRQDRIGTRYPPHDPHADPVYRARAHHRYRSDDDQAGP
ncbi:hypothetical protein DFQ28_010038 [Apophysomyces sp. BC1034]|nr:hypothetical protein DFQ28_010038 [Apophysomyces sp. BC1034]